LYLDTACAIAVIQLIRTWDGRISLLKRLRKEYTQNLAVIVGRTWRAAPERTRNTYVDILQDCDHLRREFSHREGGCSEEAIALAVAILVSS
jgi:hypothetical protein